MIRIPNRYWIRASYIASGKPWVTTEELARPTGEQLRQLWRDLDRRGLPARAREILIRRPRRRVATQR